MPSGIDALVQLVRGATLKVSTHKEQFNADLFEFARSGSVKQALRTAWTSTNSGAFIDWVLTYSKEDDRDARTAGLGGHGEDPAVACA